MLKLTGISEVEHVPLYMLEPHQCKFPVHEDWKIPGHFLFCAAPTRLGERYCPIHSGDAYQAKDQQKKRGK